MPGAISKAVFDSLRRQCMQCTATIRHDADTTKLPLELFDLAATYLTNMLHGNEFLLSMPRLGSYESFRAEANFIRRTVSRARISCSSLIVCLWYIDQFVQGCKEQSTWQPRDLFLASMVVADKYLADVSWTNADWAYNTGYRYTCKNINELERRFLRDMDFRMFVSEKAYFDFWHFLEFQLHLQTLLRSRGSQTLLSYNDLRVLSQVLTPIYTKRLRLSLRPYDAIYLLAKTVASICLVYAATVATFVSATYLVYQTSTYTAELARIMVLQRGFQEYAETHAMGDMNMTISPDTWIAYPIATAAYVPVHTLSLLPALNMEA